MIQANSVPGRQEFKGILILGDTKRCHYDIPPSRRCQRTKINHVPLEKSYQHPQICTCIYIICIIIMRVIAG
jgi:hypothetical protein